MKAKKIIFSTVCTSMMLLPWLLLLFRKRLEALIAHADVTVPLFAAFMIFCAVFTVCVYFAARVRTDLIRLCMIVNGVYAVFAFVLLIIFVTERVTPI